MADVIIIGKGPSGISAALYTIRAGLSTLVIGKDDGSLGKAEKIENYYGFIEPISGTELISNGIKQAKRLGVEVIEEEVIGIDYGEEFTAHTSIGSYCATTILFATGAARKSPKIEGVSKYEGAGVSYCAVCDGFFYRQRVVAVLGSGAYAAHEASELLAITPNVTVLTNGEEPKSEMPKGVKVDKRKIIKISGNEVLEEVIFEDNTSLTLNGLFIAIGVAGSADFARKLGAETANDKIVVNDKQATNVPGIYAAGDCTGGVLQISKAVGDGAKAGLEIINYIRNHR